LLPGGTKCRAGALGPGFAAVTRKPGTSNTADPVSRDKEPMVLFSSWKSVERSKMAEAAGFIVCKAPRTAEILYAR
jgi:hypothetical protein